VAGKEVVADPVLVELEKDGVELLVVSPVAVVFLSGFGVEPSIVVLSPGFFVGLMSAVVFSSGPLVET